MESTSEKLEHIESLLGVLIEGFKKAENKEINFPEAKNYQPTLEEINKHLILLSEQNENKALQEQISKQVTVAGNLITSINQQKEMQAELIKDIPNKIKIEYVISDNIRPYLFIFIGTIIALTISLWGNYSLWEKKSGLHENDIKFRMVQQAMPGLALYIDTLYYKNPDSLELKVKKLESHQIALQAASEAAKEKNKEAENAEKALKELRKGSSKKRDKIKGWN